MYIVHVASSLNNLKFLYIESKKCDTENKGYVNTCTNQPVDSLLQTVVIAQVDECIGPVVETCVQCSKFNVLARQVQYTAQIHLQETFFM